MGTIYETIFGRGAAAETAIHERLSCTGCVFGGIAIGAPVACVVRHLFVVAASYGEQTAMGACAAWLWLVQPALGVPIVITHDRPVIVIGGICAVPVALQYFGVAQASMCLAYLCSGWHAKMAHLQRAAWVRAGVRPAAATVLPDGTMPEEELAKHVDLQLPFLRLGAAMAAGVSATATPAGAASICVVAAAFSTIFTIKGKRLREREAEYCAPRPSAAADDARPRVRQPRDEKAE